MTAPEKDMASGYGESDIEAKAMKNASKSERPAGTPRTVPPDEVVPAAGTTESDIGRNLREKAKHESKS